jgi:hypothetical protein
MANAAQRATAREDVNTNYQGILPTFGNNKLRKM